MPLFGHKDKHDSTTTADRNDTTNSGRHHGTGTGMSGTGVNTTATGTGYGHHNAGASATGTEYNNQSTGGGYGTNANVDPYSNTAGHHNHNVPPTSAVNAGNQNHPSGGSGTSMAGKMEHALGSLVGSQALKAKGIQKEQEAETVKLQSAEISEAERLEREAMLRRERAVQHGAHPQNRQLGGVGAQEYGNNFSGSGTAGVGGPGGQIM